MKTLTKQEFEQAAHFLQTQARPLERTLFAYEFENGTAEEVIAELAKFQNDDGGFGHGLEPDLRLADSSVIATTVAFQRMREIGTSSDHPLIQKGAAYLVSTFEPERVNWHNVPANIDDAPHAFWWTYDGDVNNSLSNPRAEIAGYLNEYPEQFPAALREQVTQAVVDHLMSHPDEMEMHDLLCYVRFAETAGLPEETKALVLGKLKRVVGATVARDPAAWKEYGLPPLSVVETPASPFAGDFEAEIPLNLDFMIESRSADGSWKPNWSWDDQGTGEWARAQREWTGVITLDNLRKLKAFGRME